MLKIRLFQFKVHQFSCAEFFDLATPEHSWVIAKKVQTQLLILWIEMSKLSPVLTLESPEAKFMEKQPLCYNKQDKETHLLISSEG